MRAAHGSNLKISRTYYSQILVSKLVSIIYRHRFGSARKCSIITGLVIQVKLFLSGDLERLGEQSGITLHSDQ